MKALVYALFLLSGACGLIYEIVWSRLLAQVLGNTVLAVGAVLAAYMTGLALGSWGLGGTGDRSRRPLRLYGYYEIGIGLTALASLHLIDRAAAAPALALLAGGDRIGVSALRFCLAFLLLLAPTILMGATLPILSRLVIHRRADAGAGLGSLYAVNTAGAVAGALLAGFLLLGTLGIHATVYVAVAANVAVGGVAWLSSARAAGRPDPPGPPPQAPAPLPARRLLLWAIGLSGVTSFAYEVLWTRALVHLTGNSTYAFTMMLTVFLSGIALGGWLVRFLPRSDAGKVRGFGILQILAGLAAGAALPVSFRIVSSPEWQEFVARASAEFGTLALSTFAVAGAILLVPATLLGASFPLVGSLFVDDLRRTGARVGKVYAVNTLGNVIGALAPALLILPVYGVQQGIVLMAALNLTVGLSVLLAGTRLAAGARFLLTVLLAGAALALPRLPSRFQFPSEDQAPADRVLFYREGIAATTKVYEDPDTGGKRMSIDGIVIGGTESTDYKQQVLAHLPKLLRPGYRSELSIGLGSGILIGESLRHAGLQELVCLEIEPSVLEGAAWFAEENHGVLQDPRARIVIDDVGGFLRSTKGRYDIISADEKTADRFASNGFSYSSDYYRLLRDHLADDGLVIQWVPNQIPASQYRSVLRTFAGSFPEVALFYLPPLGKGGPTNTFLIGSPGPIRLDAASMNDSLARDPAAFAGLRRYGLESGEAILAHYVAGGDAIRAATGDARRNSLEHPYYEFYSPREYAIPVNRRVLDNHRLLHALRLETGPYDLPDPGGRLSQATRAEDEFLRGLQAHLEGRPEGEALASFERALATAGWNDNLRWQVFSFLWNRGAAEHVRGDDRAALASLGRAVAVYPDHGEARYHHGLTLLRAGQTEAALAEIRAALELDPRLLAPRRALASVLLEAGAFEEAGTLLREVLEWDPDDLFALVTDGVLQAETRRDFRRAGERLERARRLAPSDPAVIDARAWVAWLRGDREEARSIVLAGGDYHLGHPAFQRRRATILQVQP